MPKQDLQDGYGRVIRNVRISVTDRCNFRCVYCMPKTPVWMPHSDVLNFEEIERLARIFVGLGVEKIRVTGGEPTVRHGIVDLIRRLVAVVPEVTMTTNGYFLPKMAKELREAGLRRINISIDTLDAQKFREVTRTSHLEEVLKGIEAAEAAGFRPVKLNCVVMRGYNEDQVVPLLTYARDKGYEMRFIEFMPLDADNIWDRTKVYTKAEMLAQIRPTFPFHEDPEARPSDPAARYLFDDGRGSFGVIASVSDPFCTKCDRTRLTADGKFRTCLFSIKECDLRAPLRSGASDAEIERLIREWVWGKEPGHFINSDAFQKPERTMHRIGG
jgi:cyclic pyranopterin phosphate synthase